MCASQTMGCGPPKVCGKKIVEYQIHTGSRHEGTCLIPAPGGMEVMVEASGSEVQVQLQVCSEFEASLCYMRSYIQKQKDLYIGVVIQHS